MTMSSALRAAYKTVVVQVGRRRFSVGDCVPALVVITAYNPQSRRVLATTNRAAQRELCAELSARGYRFVRAVNAPGTKWAEPSVVVYGARVATLLSVAERFGQHAIYGTRRGRLALVYRRDGKIVYEA